MRLLIVVPPQVRTTGNWVTAERLQNGLITLGHTVTICVAESDEITAALAAGVDLALLMHAYRSGQPWRESGAELPYLVMLTGTDYYQGLMDPVRGPIIADVLDQAELIVIKNRRELKKLAQNHPGFALRLRYLPPGVLLGEAPCLLREELGLSATDFLFLCPAGIRPVKGIIELLELFDLVAARRSFKVVFCGPILDEIYGERFLSALTTRRWAYYVGNLATDAMPATMRQADVVLNNSVSEGLSNVLVEAATLGRPILAHAIPGNAEVVDEGINGLLYRDGEDFTTAVLRLIDEPELRARLSRPDPERFSAEHEAQRLNAFCLAVLEQQ